MNVLLLYTIKFLCNKLILSQDKLNRSIILISIINYNELIIRGIISVIQRSKNWFILVNVRFTFQSFNTSFRSTSCHSNIAANFMAVYLVIQQQQSLGLFSKGWIVSAFFPPLRLLIAFFGHGSENRTLGAADWARARL